LPLSTFYWKNTPPLFINGGERVKFDPVARAATPHNRNNPGGEHGFREKDAQKRAADSP
jgi:hypothetical protein